MTPPHPDAQGGIAERLRALGSGRITVQIEIAEMVYDLRAACRNAAAELDRLHERIRGLEGALHKIGESVTLATNERLATVDELARVIWAKMKIASDALNGEFVDTALLTARTAGEEAWKTIDSAPKDGTPILGINDSWFGDGAPLQCRWVRGEWVLDPPLMTLGRESHIDDPTHWKPLTAGGGLPTKLPK